MDTDGTCENLGSAVTTFTRTDTGRVTEVQS
jgi:hypothetical protein